MGKLPMGLSPPNPLLGRVWLDHLKYIEVWTLFSSPLIGLKIRLQIDDKLFIYIILTSMFKI